MQFPLAVAVFPILLLSACAREPVANPDPGHIHADFAVWVNGEKLDFSDERFIMTPEKERTLAADDPARYLHLHDETGHVIHSHKPGQTFGMFLESVGFALRELPSDLPEFPRTCVTVPDGAMYCDGEATEGRGWIALVNDAPPGCRRLRERIVCGGPDQKQVSSGSDMVDIWSYVFHDGDQLLISFGDFFESGEEGVTPDTLRIRREWSEMTDDACIYSRTCPWRGEPPAEKCVSDPTVPCVWIDE